jgi:hypothetical protein
MTHSDSSQQTDAASTSSSGLPVSIAEQTVPVTSLGADVRANLRSVRGLADTFASDLQDGQFSATKLFTELRESVPDIAPNTTKFGGVGMILGALFGPVGVALGGTAGLLYGASRDAAGDRILLAIHATDVPADAEVIPTSDERLAGCEPVELAIQGAKDTYNAGSWVRSTVTRFRNIDRVETDLASSLPYTATDSPDHLDGYYVRDEASGEVYVLLFSDAPPTAT